MGKYEEKLKEIEEQVGKLDEKINEGIKQIEMMRNNRNILVGKYQAYFELEEENDGEGKDGKRSKGGKK